MTKRYTFFFESGGSISITGRLLTSDDEYLITDSLNAETVIQKNKVKRYVSTP